MEPRSPHFRSIQTLEHVLGADPAVVRGYARAAADAFASGPLTFDARSRLLSRGQRLGISRFDANLILAAVEQRSGGHRDQGMLADLPASAEQPWLLRAFTAAVGIQSLIIAGAWWLFR